MSHIHKIIIGIVILFYTVGGIAQKQRQSLMDSLLIELPKAKTEKQRAIILNDLASSCGQNDPGKAIQYAENALNLGTKNGWKDVLSRSYNLLGMNHQRKKNYDEAIDYYLQALKLNEDSKNLKNIAALSASLGAVYQGKKDNSNALNYYLKAADFNEETGNKKNLSVLCGNIGSVYADMSNTDKALEYFLKSYGLHESLGNRQGMATTSGNIANIYKNQNNNPKALDYYLTAYRINESLENTKGAALNANSIGSQYFGQENYTKAIEFYSKSQKAYEQIGNKEGVARNIGNIGVTYLKMAQSTGSQSDREQWQQQAIDKLDNAAKQLEEIGSKEAAQQFSRSLYAAQNLSSAESASKAVTSASKRTKKDSTSLKEDQTPEKSLADLSSYYNRKQDSIKLESRNKELKLRKEIDLQQLKFEYERKRSMAKTEEERQQLRQEEAIKRQEIEKYYNTLLDAVELERKLTIAMQEKKDAETKAEIQRQKNIRNGSIAIGTLILIILMLVYRNFRNQKKANILISAGKQRSEELLLNILPQEVADELKLYGKTEARLYNEVSVLFTDFVNFTKTSEKLSPQELVNELDACFSAFDCIIERNGLEKIKTMGDAYMAVCGLPESNPDHAKKTVQAALEIRNFIDDRRQYENVFEIRIGINSGQVVAGIVGLKKFAYDIWGDAVNTAARMESSGETGKVNISETTYDLIKNDFECTNRGKIIAKNKGEVNMYFVDELRKIRTVETVRQEDLANDQYHPA